MPRTEEAATMAQMALVDRVVTQWFSEHRRELPWRSTDPWGVYVSEIMLQQTPVSRVLPAWHEWRRRWPTPTSLADDSVGEAIRAWGRLGYPRRAKRLHEAAVVMRDEHRGAVPDTEEALRRLPGVGEYTAAAVAAFAFGRSSVVVDINVRRFLVRLHTGNDPAASYSAAERALAEAVYADLEVPAPLWAAASMEFGALVCTSRAPACQTCPLAEKCDWVPGPRTSRTQAYEGTDRQARGVVLHTLRAGPADSFDWPDPDQLQRALDGLLADGLVVRDRLWSLPD
ncbi:MAG: A/G-specific adenine glycosylase [Candidatus Nanopelagicales bacterium]|nr:A/G-specific adenine glycosylase [Candidatus Nanopelagicales bacterium]